MRRAGPPQSEGRPVARVRRRSTEGGDPGESLADDELVKARKTVERLKGLRLVYPDGTLQELVNKVIAKRVDDALA